MTSETIDPSEAVLPEFSSTMGTSDSVHASAALYVQEIKRAYPLKPDLPLKTDSSVNFPRKVPVQERVILSKNFPPVWNQQNTNACTAFAISGIFGYFQNLREKNLTSDPSRFFQYYFERAQASAVFADAGVTMRDATSAFLSHGICPESVWPSLLTNLFTMPSPIAVGEATTGDVVYSRKLHTSAATNVPNSNDLLTEMKEFLSEGIPVLAGIVVYDSFESEDADLTGHIPMPNPVHENVLGGHAIVLVGYNDAYNGFIFRNSWGDQWGAKGYGVIPYSYIIDYCITAWILSDKPIGPQ